MEMRFRRELSYPPYYFTVQVLVSHQDEEVAIQKSYEISQILKQNLTEKPKFWDQLPDQLPEHIIFIIIKF